MTFDLRRNEKFGPETILVVFLVISRWPLLIAGYGSDGDAWRVAVASDHLWKTGEYIVSRLPGYPLHEILMAPIVALGGSLAANGSTLIAFFAASLIWLRWCRATAAHPLLLTAAFVFTPLVWIASAATMDYVWSLLFLLAAMNAASRSRSVMAGILIGCAAGFRPSNLAFAIVPVVQLLHFPDSRRPIFLFAVSLAATLLASFSPVIFSMGPVEWWRGCLAQFGGVSTPIIERTLSAAYRSVYAFGPLAVVSGVIVLFLRRREFLDRWRMRDPVVRPAIAGIAAFALTFWLLPAERAYLIPVLPLGLMLLDRVASRTSLAWVVACLVSFAFVNPDVVRHEGLRGTPGFQVRAGILFEELERRQGIEQIRAQVRTMAFGEPTIVLTGQSAQVWFENGTYAPDDTALAHVGVQSTAGDQIDVPARRPDSPETILMSVVTRDQLRRARSAGFRIVCLDVARLYVESVGGFLCKDEQVAVIASTTSDDGLNLEK